MNLLTEQQLEEPSDCGYLPGRQRQCSYFLAEDLSSAELDQLLSAGWRKFGPYFFRPACSDCRACIPLRVSVPDFKPSRSQKRILRRNRHLEARVGPLQFSHRIYDIYRSHAELRFGEQKQDLEHFLFSFYCPPCPGRQTEIRLDGELIAVGWLDLGEQSLSSIYFCFDPAYAEHNLGTFGALAELEYARQQGLPWYYLGYYVPGNRRTAYKDHFRPRQHFDWARQAWAQVSNPPEGGAPQSTAINFPTESE